MSKQTKIQQKNEYFAKLCDEISGNQKSQSSKELRSINRRIDKRKGKSKFQLDKKRNEKKER
jgi:hypothetical protein